jgi:hypothetical protein
VAKQNGTVPLENGLAFSYKVKYIHLNLAISLLDMYPREKKSHEKTRQMPKQLDSEPSKTVNNPNGL